MLKRATVLLLDREAYDSPYSQCLRHKQEECRVEYNAKVLDSMALAVAVMAGCLAMTTPGNLVICTAAALAMHFLQVAATRQRFQFCFNSAPYNCRRELGL